MATAQVPQRSTREVLEDILDRALQSALRANLSAAHTEPLHAALELVRLVDADAAGAQLERDRLTRYAERLEQANSVLTGRLASLQEYAEKLGQALAPALDAVTDSYHRAAQLKSASGQPIALNDFTKRGRVTEATLAAVREAPDMAHGD
jgi:hypothetical protein